MTSSVDYLKMEAGPELDAMIEEKIIGGTVEYIAMQYYEWSDTEPAITSVAGHQTSDRYEVERRVDRFTKSGSKGWYVGIVATPYSTDISAAFQVVEKMREKEWGFCLGLNGCTPRQNGAKFFRGVLGLGHSIFEAESIDGEYCVDETIPLAICKAALLAAESLKEETS